MHWLSAELFGIAPAESRKVRRHRETNRHRPCADSRQPRVCIAHQIGRDGADVVSQVHVFGEAPDDAVCL